MEEKRFTDEKLDIRKFYLRLKTKLPLVALGIAAGMALLGLGYVMYDKAARPATYSAQSVIHLTFAYDESGEIYDYYNAYTWNDIIHTDKVLEYVGEAYEEESASGGADVKALADMTKAEMPSDYRVLKIVSENEDAILAESVCRAYTYGVAEFINDLEGFEEAEIYSVGEAEKVTYPDRLMAAVIFGGISGALIALFVLWVMAIVDDRVFVPEDIERRYGIPATGIVPLGAGKDTGYPAVFLESFRGNLRALKKEYGALRVVIVSEAPRDEEEIRREIAEVEGYISGCEDLAGVFTCGEDKDLPVVLFVESGKPCALAGRVLSDMKARGLEVKGFVMRGEIDFLRRYYGVK